ncbi:hypothetical protein [uncultured Rikenella sp.]|nr:hypothetical protein [uncultured Rikenella sp.]
MWLVGNSGYSYTSSINSTSGIALDFGVTWFLPSLSGSRGLGFQLRCLSE